MDLLSLARIESQAGMLSRQSIDLHSILEEAMRRYEATAERGSRRLFSMRAQARCASLEIRKR